MKYLHIKKIEEYTPNYKDRNLIWCKAYFKMINSDPEFEMLCEIDKWRFLAFVMLELQIKKPITLDESYLFRKGFNFKHRSLSNTLDQIGKSIEIYDDLMQIVEINNVTQLLKERHDSVTQNREEKRREESCNNVSYVEFEDLALSSWNNFCDKHTVLSKVKAISGKRKDKLRNRFGDLGFKEFEVIIKAVEIQPFLLGNNDRKWKISFDWLIENDTNYLKVLEMKYKNEDAFIKKDKWNDLNTKHG